SRSHGPSSMDTVTPVRIWISQLKEGDPVAAQQLWDIYFGRMVQAARLKLHGVPGRMADEEDVALSAFKSFCRGTQDGRFPHLLEYEDPWPLLLALTTHKAVDLVRHERRIKRGGPGRDSPPPGAPDGSPPDGDALTQVVGREPDPRWT